MIEELNRPMGILTLFMCIIVLPVVVLVICLSLVEKKQYFDCGSAAGAAIIDLDGCVKFEVGDRVCGRECTYLGVGE